MKAGDKVGSNALPSYAQFQLGGFFNLSGYSEGQFTGGNVQYGRVMYYRRILKGGVFEGAYGGFSLEAGKVGKSLVPGNSEATQKSASAFVAADSPLGPVYIGYGHSDQGDNNLYFVLGRVFQ
jgi:NTE family protein